MTEYKKLCEVVAQLRTRIDGLVCGAESSSSSDNNDNNTDVDACSNDTDVAATRYQAAMSLKNDAVAAAVRVRKLVARARETNPERQLYNETMCGKIEQLFAEYCQQLARVLQGDDKDAGDKGSAHDDDDTMTTEAGAATTATTTSTADATGHTESADNNNKDKAESDVATRVAEAVMSETTMTLSALFDHSTLYVAVADGYDAYMLRCAQHAAWRSRVAHDMATATAYEADGRVVVAATERRAREELRAAADAARADVTRLLRAQAETRWRDEGARRRDEQTRLRRAATAVGAAGGVVAYVCQQLGGDAPSSVQRRALLVRLHELVAALRRHPEDVHIRRLRCNNAQLMHAFGHHCLVRRDDDDAGDAHDAGATAAAQMLSSCVCRRVSDVCEAVWCHLGFTVEYTSGAVTPLMQQLREGACADVTMPCGASLSQHVYVPLGYEVYGERFVVLHEPDAVTQPDAWMAWYTTMQDAEEHLVDALATTAAPSAAALHT